MKKDKILVVFYSRTGNTGKLGNNIAKELGCDIEEILDKKTRKGVFGYIIGGKDAFQNNITEISYMKDVSKYDLIIIGTPVWAGKITPAVRAYIGENKSKLRKKKLAFFCTFGGNECKVFEEMNQLAGRPIGVFGLKYNEVDNMNKIKDFCRKLRK